MALSDDQRALLGLLVGGDTYERVAEVTGTSVDEVKTRAREAAAALEKDPEPGLPPDVVRGRLEALGRPGGAAVPAPADPGRRATVRAQAPWLLVGAAIVVAIVVVAVIRHSGGGDQSPQPPTAGQEEAVPIRLTPVNGSKASGGVTLIRIGDQPAIDLAIRGLTPTGPGQSYVLWFVGSGGRALPVAFRAVGPDGQLSGRAAIPTAATGLLPSFTTAELALVRQSVAAAAVKQAAQNDTLPEPVGRIVMRGALRG
jgi:hypothetical protein